MLKKLRNFCTFQRVDEVLNNEVGAVSLEYAIIAFVAVCLGILLISFKDNIKEFLESINDWISTQLKLPTE